MRVRIGDAELAAYVPLCPGYPVVDLVVRDIDGIFMLSPQCLAFGSPIVSRRSVLYRLPEIAPDAFGAWYSFIHHRANASPTSVPPRTTMLCSARVAWLCVSDEPGRFYVRLSFSEGPVGVLC